MSIETWTVQAVDGVAAYVRASDGARRDVLFASSYPHGARATMADGTRFVSTHRTSSTPEWVSVNVTSGLYWLDAACADHGPTVEIRTA